MRYAGIGLRLMVGLALVFALGAALAPAASAQEAGSVTIHKAECPPGYTGDDFFGDCHDNPMAGVTFTAAGPEGYLEERTTGAEGTVVFDGITVSGTVEIAEDFPAGIAEFAVFCSLFDPSQPVDFTYTDTGIALFVEAGTDILCDWYNVPVAEDGVDTFDLPIFKLACQADPGQGAVMDFLTVGTVPAGCDQIAGVAVTVADADGTVLGSCVTRADAACFVTVPIGITVFATEDLATVPAGFVPLVGHTLQVQIEPATEAAVLFINVPAAQPTPAPPAPTPTPAPTQPGVPGAPQLPSTGVGTTASETEFGTQLAWLAALAAACAAAATTSVRRRAVAPSKAWPGARRGR